MTHSQPPSREAVRAELDLKIAALQVKTRELQRQRNALADISRLPNEILCDIFKIYKHQQLEHGTRFRFDTSAMQWVVITGVSHHWRRVALDTPSLWSDISSKDSRAEAWVFTKLERSIPGPISVKLVIDDEQLSPPIEEAISSHSSRITHLHLEGRTRLMQHYLNKFVPPPAVSLQEVTVDHQGLHGPLPLSLPQNWAPSLRRLSLKGCEVKWTTVPLSDKLTTLSIVEREHITPLSPQLLLGTMLPKLVNIVELELRLPLAPIDLDSLPKRHIQLPNLRKLVLVDRSFAKWTVILERLILPSKTHIYLASRGQGSKEEAVEALVSIVASQTRRPSPSQGAPLEFRTLSMHPRCGESFLQVQLWSKDPPTIPAAHYHEVMDDTEGSIRITDSRARDVDECKYLLSRLPTQTIRAFAFEAVARPKLSDMSYMPWDTIFPLLEHLVLQDQSSAQVFTTYLSNDPTFYERSEALRLPNLRRITLRELRPKTKDFQTGFDFETLFETLQNRAESSLGCRIEELHFEQCSTIPREVYKRGSNGDEARWEFPLQDFGLDPPTSDSDSASDVDFPSSSSGWREPIAHHVVGGSRPPRRPEAPRSQR